MSSRLLSTRGGTVVLGALAAVLAAVILLVYLNRYRESVSSSAAPQTVLVARNLIPKGTSGGLVGNKELFQPATLPGEQVKEGAITDPALLKGRVAVDDIYPGQQLTVTDFSAVGADAVATRITGDQRAVSVPIDSAHGNIGVLQNGDHVDVWGGFNVVADGKPEQAVLALIAPNVLVVSAPGAVEAGAVGGGSQSSNIVLQLSNDQATKVAFSSDNGRLWVMLRPRAGSTATRPRYTDIQTIMLGLKPLRTKEAAK